MDISKITEWLKLSTQQLFWLLLFSSVVLTLLSFAPNNALGVLGLSDFRTEYRTWIGLLWILSFSGLVVTTGRFIWQWVKGIISERRRLKHHQERLNHLTPPERAILRRYIEGNTRTQTLRIDDGVVKGLEGEVILYRAAQIGDLYRGFDYNIQPWAWDYLKSHPELVEG